MDKGQSFLPVIPNQHDLVKPGTSFWNFLLSQQILHPQRFVSVKEIAFMMYSCISFSKFSA